MMVNLTHQKRLSRFKRSITDANKIALLFQYFWNSLFDRSPLYCFSCGEYIPIHKRDPEFYQRPYKKDPIHSTCWDALRSDDFVKRLNDESHLICHLDLGWGVHGSVCRGRIQNNPYSIMVHLIKKHGWVNIPELRESDFHKEMKELADSAISNAEFSETRDSKLKKLVKSYINNPQEWFNDNQLIWEHFRSTHFLKPNGRSFPKVHDF
jgi:hypothetical protein